VYKVILDNQPIPIKL